MKLLLDQNLSHRLVGSMSTAFPGSIHVRNLGMAEAGDEIVWTYAARHGFVIVSKDSDFQQRALLHGPPPKVIWLRVGNCSSAKLESLLLSRQAEITAFDSDPDAAFLALA